MAYRWVCGNCGNDRTVTDTLHEVPNNFWLHVTKDDHACMRREAFYVELEETNG